MVDEIDDERQENWNMYRKLVISKLDDLRVEINRVKEDVAADLRAFRTEEVAKLRADITTLTVEIAIIKTKAAMIGAGTGIVCAAVVTYVMKLLGAG